MPRVCTICSHPERKAIDQALLGQEPIRRIAEKFSLSETSIRRHKEAGHLPVALIRAQELEEAARGDDLLDQLRAIMARVQKLFLACDVWLADPLDPSRYEIGPRAEEIQVVYSEEAPDGKRVRRKARLSNLLAQAGQQKLSFEVIEVRHADPRELVLKTANTLRASLEMMLKVTEVKDLESRLIELERTIEAREERWISVSGSTRSRSVMTGRR